MASYFLNVVGVAAWYACRLFAFWLAMRIQPGREQTGRTLTGVGALFMATSLVLPQTNPPALLSLLLGLMVIGAGVALLVGLYLSFPQRGLTSVVRGKQAAPDPDEGEASDDQAPPDAGENG